MPKKLSREVKDNTKKKIKRRKEYEGNFSSIVSTGSTLLDLAISGGRIRGGGLPGGILVEIFGPSGSGKTVLLCEIGGAIQRQGGINAFNDPESRLDKQFARMFDLHTKEIAYATPNTVSEVFKTLWEWEPEDTSKINGFLTDSLAALSTNMEMDNAEGDKMGTRRAKELSEGLRKAARRISDNNLLMVCSNQVRVNLEAGMFQEKYKTPGGEAVGFYSTVRLRTFNPKKIKQTETIAGKKVERVIGVTTHVEVYKNSVWSPYRKAPVTIIFDYGVDDIRENLQFLKTYTSSTTYMIGQTKLARSLEDSIRMVEEEELEDDLKDAVIELWQDIEDKFKSERKRKKR